MYDIKITVKKIIINDDLIKEYENPINHACMMKLNQEFVSIDSNIPKGFCASAWLNLYPYVFSLANGATNLFDGWMKNKKSAMISCNDGFRPVIFYLEVIE